MLFLFFWLCFHLSTILLLLLLLQSIFAFNFPRHSSLYSVHFGLFLSISTYNSPTRFRLIFLSGCISKHFGPNFFWVFLTLQIQNLSFLIRHFSRFSFILPAKGKEVNWLVWNFVLNCWSLLSFFKNIKATRRHTSSSPRFNLFKRHDFWISLSIINNTQTWNSFFLDDHLLLSNTDFLF